MSDREQLFEIWLSDSVSQEQKQQIESELIMDPVFKARMDTARAIEHIAHATPNVEVPSWDKEQTFTSDVRPWWQWQGLPAMSMAFSFAAILLVLFRVELSVTDNGMLLSFAGSKDTQQSVVELVDEKLQAFSQQQQLALASYKSDLVSQQQQSNLQLASYILDTSRQERKEDISDFISFISQQRKDDQLQQRIQYRQLEEAMLLQTQYINNQGATVQQANWVAEE